MTVSPRNAPLHNHFEMAPRTLSTGNARETCPAGQNTPSVRDRRWLVPIVTAHVRRELAGPGLQIGHWQAEVPASFKGVPQTVINDDDGAVLREDWTSPSKESRGMQLESDAWHVPRR